MADMQRLLAILEARGWSGLLGSLDCMHWKRENFSMARDDPGKVSPCSSVILLVNGDHCNTLMSLWDLDIPKKACQIQKSYDATASRMMDFLRWPWYCSRATFATISNPKDTKSLTWPRTFRFYTPLLQLFVDLQNNGIRRPYESWWHVMWSCTP